MYSLKEGMEMWKFAISINGEYRRYELWNHFKKTVGSNRTLSSLYHRFTHQLIPRLPSTNFHTETKLKLCVAYEVIVDQNFLKELEKEAHVKLGEDGLVLSYKLKSNAGPNRDNELSDEAFKEIIAPSMAYTNPITGNSPMVKRFQPVTGRRSPAVRKSLSAMRKFQPFTAEEDKQMWNHILDNPLTVPRYKYWADYAKKIKSQRSYHSFLYRFSSKLSPDLQKTSFDVETKLKLFKNAQIVVDKEYLKTLKNYAELELDPHGSITSYTLLNRSAKRTSSRRSEEIEVKKPLRESNRLNGQIHVINDIDSDSDDDLIIEPDIAGTNPKRPKIEIEDDYENQLNAEDVKPMVPRWAVKHENNAFGSYGHSSYNSFDESTYNDNRASATSSSNQFLVEKMAETLKEVVVGEINLSREILKKELRTVHARMESMEKKIASIKVSRNGSDQKEEEERAPNMKQYLKNLKSLVTSLKSPEMEGIEQRIEAAISEMPEDDEQPLPTRLIRSMFDAGLTMIGH